MMRHLQRLLLIVVAMLTLASCNHGDKTPEGVATTFLEALSRGDYDAAYSCTTGPESDRETVAGYYKQMQLVVTDYRVNSVDMDPDGQHAVVNVTTTMTSIFNAQAATSDEHYNAVLVDGRWRLDL